MVQSYLRHGPTQVGNYQCSSSWRVLTQSQAFGLICTNSSNSIYDGKIAYVPALEDVLVWDMKRGEMVSGIYFLPVRNSQRLV